MQNPLAIAPIGIPGFFWGRPGERLVEQMLTEYPRCLGDPTGGALGGVRERACVRRHGLMEWFTLHLQVRGAFTTLYRNLTPAVWQSTFRHGARALPVPQLLRTTHQHERRVHVHAEEQRSQWATRLCCGLRRRAFVPCNLGCAPWRMLYAYPANASATDDVVTAGHEPNEQARDTDCDVGAVTLWEQPAVRGAEATLLHPNKRQTWPNGAMRCDVSARGRSST